MSKQRVLIFGAYGNGNLGDAIQPRSLARAITRFRPDIEVFAASYLQIDPDYPFDATRKLGPAQVMDTPALNNST